jgi:hypothetical protein
LPSPPSFLHAAAAIAAIISSLPPLPQSSLHPAAAIAAIVFSPRCCHRYHGVFTLLLSSPPYDLESGACVYMNRISGEIFLSLRQRMALLG